MHVVFLQEETPAATCSAVSMAWVDQNKPSKKNTFVFFKKKVPAAACLAANMGWGYQSI